MTPVERRGSASLAMIYAARMLGFFLVLPVFALEAARYPGGSDPALVGLGMGMYGLTQAVLQIAYGLASDRLGRKPVMIWPQLIALLLTYPTFLWIVHAPGVLSLLFGFGMLSLIGSLPFTAFYATFTEALPQNIRGGVFAVIYAVAIASFGGTAQLVVTWLLHVSGDPLAASWYLLLAAVVGLIAMSLMPETAPVKVGRT